VRCCLFGVLLTCVPCCHSFHLSCHSCPLSLPVQLTALATTGRFNFVMKLHGRYHRVLDGEEVRGVRMWRGVRAVCRGCFMSCRDGGGVDGGPLCACVRSALLGTPSRPPPSAPPRCPLAPQVAAVDQYLNKLTEREVENAQDCVACEGITVVTPELHNLLPFLDAFDVVRWRGATLPNSPAPWHPWLLLCAARAL
jgi:hypothetical protein